MVLQEEPYLEFEGDMSVKTTTMKKHHSLLEPSADYAEDTLVDE